MCSGRNLSPTMHHESCGKETAGAASNGTTGYPMGSCCAGRRAPRSLRRPHAASCERKERRLPALAPTCVHAAPLATRGASVAMAWSIKRGLGAGGGAGGGTSLEPLLRPEAAAALSVHGLLKPPPTPPPPGEARRCCGGTGGRTVIMKAVSQPRYCSATHDARSNPVSAGHKLGCRGPPSATTRG